MIVNRIAVLGPGRIGRQIALAFALGGCRVSLVDLKDRPAGATAAVFADARREIGRDLRLMAEEGVIFRPGVNVGVDITAEELRATFDAVCLTGGSTVPRDLPVPGRELGGIHFAMDYLTQQNRVNAGDFLASEERITAFGKRVVTQLPVSTISPLFSVCPSSLRLLATQRRAAAWSRYP